MDPRAQLSIYQSLTQRLNAEDPCPRAISTYTQNSYISIILCFNNTILYFSYGKITDPSAAVFYGAAMGIWWEKNTGWEEILYFNDFAFTRKTLAFCHKKYCVPPEKLETFALSCKTIAFPWNVKALKYSFFSHLTFYVPLGT